MTIYLSSVDALIGCSMAGRCLGMTYSCCCKRRGCASYDTRWTLFFLHCGAFSYLHDGDFEATQSDIERGGTCFGASAVLSAPATSSLAHGWPRSRDCVARVLAQQNVLATAYSHDDEHSLYHIGSTCSSTCMGISTVGIPMR